MAEEEKTEVTTEEHQETGKTFTQEEVNSIIGVRLAEVKKGQPTSEELKAFRDWQKTQKTEAEKQAERDAAYQAATRENAQLKAEKQALAAKAKPEFVEFVSSKVLAMEGDFAKNLEIYKKSNPQYFGETVVRKVSSSPSVSAGSEGGTKTNDIMNDLLRSRGR